MSPQLCNAIEPWVFVFDAIFASLIIVLALLVASPFLIVAWVAGGCE